jgi:hypothetical protein
MVSTLQQLCYERLATTMMKAPPLLQDIIARETRESMEKRVREYIWRDECVNCHHIFSHLVPDIMEDLIRITVTPGALRPDYLVEYPHLLPEIVTSAVFIAEEAVRRMESRYVHAAFRIANKTNSD